MRFLISYVFIGLVITGHICAMDSVKVKKVKVEKSIGTNLINDAEIFAKDAGAYFTLPLHMSGEAWLWTAGVLGGTAVSMTLDRRVKRSISVNTRHTYNRDILDVPTVYGFVQYPSAAAGALYVTGLFLRDDEVRTVARLWLEGLVFGGSTVMGLRYIFGRYRPIYSDDPWKYTWFQTKGDTQSFPSGHTVVAFTTSAVFAEYIDSWWARIPLYALAAATGYTRLRNNQHWFSDVVSGALLGFGTGWYVVYRERERQAEVKKQKKGGGRFSVYPSWGGLTVVWTL